MYEEGLAEAEKASQLEHEFAISLLIRGWIYLDQGKVQDGMDQLEKAAEINPAWKYIGYGPALLENGYIQKGKAILEELEMAPLNGYRALCLAVMYADLKDYDKSFEYLNYEQKHAWFPWIRVMFLPEEMRTDPRYLKLIRDMNLPDPAPLDYNPEL